MNGSGGRSVAWSAVFSRAHRRVALRLAVVAAIGAVGAALLLGGGVATRNKIQDNRASHPTEEPTPTSPPAEEPNLVLSAQPIEEEAGEETEESEAGEQGKFTVVNESPVDAEAFNVVATPQSTGVPQVIKEVPALPAGEHTSGGFGCPEGDSVVVEIESSQPNNGGMEVPCPEGLSKNPETTDTTTQPTAPTEPEPTEPESTKPIEEE
jgi:hypothetical protein